MGAPFVDSNPRKPFSCYNHKKEALWQSYS